MNFRRLTLKDRDIAEKLLDKEKRFGCGYTFAVNYIWQDVFDVFFSFDYNCYTAKSVENGKNSYFFPSGEKNDILSLISSIINSEGKGSVFKSLEEQDKKLLEEEMPGVFEFSSDKSESDYIYNTEELIKLKGKKFQSKRNFIRRFNDNQNWHYEDINQSNINECIELNLLWSDDKNILVDRDRKKEIGAANTALACFYELNLSGGLIRQDGKVVAYSIGEPINDEVYVVHFEKATDIKGAYPTITNEFLKHNCADYKYVNREEDMGDEGLRKAKLSYHPAIILTKYRAVVK